MRLQELQTRAGRSGAVVGLGLGYRSSGRQKEKMSESNSEGSHDMGDELVGSGGYVVKRW